MKASISQHTFHIPVMGLGFTIDTPVKVAKYGISSVISIVEDGLIEQMRAFYCQLDQQPYLPIDAKEEDYRAKRITDYLNIIHSIVQRQSAIVKQLPFCTNSDIDKYFELLPNYSYAKKLYYEMVFETDNNRQQHLQQQLRKYVIPGAIDVNIMAKIDKPNFTAAGEPLPKEYSDALAGLRGFANSNLHSSIVLSAGYNPNLYSYVEHFPDFFPNEAGILNKKIILKVSDYRSALTQGKLFAKKGVWVSEFRIESGLNCGGHAFATDGILLGPILEEFKQNREALFTELFGMCNAALQAKNLPTFTEIPYTRITVQGGIGTANEDQFLLNYYQLDGTGWGSPFLLVPDATNVDTETLQQLATAQKEDYFLSNASPLGVPFNNFRKSSSEIMRKQRIDAGRPGSPCTRKNLISNTDFTDTAICTASRKYQFLKINDLASQNLSAAELEKELQNVYDKDCLCEGLSNPALVKNNIEPAYKNSAVAICPGPNLAYFSGVFSLKQMVDHIYGRTNLLNKLERPNVFVNELVLYVAYLQNEIDKYLDTANNQKLKYFQKFKTNLLIGIQYYKDLFTTVKTEAELSLQQMSEQLNELEIQIQSLSVVPNQQAVTA